MISDLSNLAVSTPTPRAESVPYTHAHNDYEHEYPLFNALSQGFISVEADIWLYANDDDILRVAHDFTFNPTDLPTLEELYLDPLQTLYEQVDNGGIYADGTPITLLVDIKSDGLTTYQRLDQILSKYQAESPGLFTTYSQDDQGNYIITPGAVTPLISGNRPRDYIENQETRYAGYDGRKSDLGTGADPGFIPLISDNWNNFFSGDLAWNGIGIIPDDTQAELERIVEAVHEENKILRFWNLPQDAPSVWKPLYEAGVDLINTDNLGALSSFIQFQESIPPTVSGTAGDDVFDALFPDEKLFVGENQILSTGSGDDTVDVTEAVGGNTLRTASGDDIIYAGTNNRIMAGNRDDLLFLGSGGGNNRVTGGSGTDQFWLTEDDDLLPTNPNIIGDFNLSDGDVIGFLATDLTFDSLGSDWSYRQSGFNTVIEAFGQNVAILQGISATSLTEDNFVFA